jgi:hypothetical protein
MLSGHLRRDGTHHHGSQCSQESSDSDLESQNSSQIQTKSKQAYNNFTCWKFQDTIQADFSDLGSLGERRQKLTEHFLTRTSSEQPLCVRSVTVFADLEQLVFEAPDETRTISISIIGYVQTKQSRTFTMTNWMKSANWEPITGGLFSNCQFLTYLDYAESPSNSWYKMPIFGEGCRETINAADRVNCREMLSVAKHTWNQVSNESTYPHIGPKCRAITE